MLVPYTNDIEKYIESSDIIDYTLKEVSDLAEFLFAKSETLLDYAYIGKVRCAELF